MRNKNFIESTEKDYKITLRENDNAMTVLKKLIITWRSQLMYYVY